MTIQPSLKFGAKMELLRFSGEVKSKYPQHEDDITSLGAALQSKNAFPPDVRAKMIEKINQNPEAVTKSLAEKFEKNPALLKEYGKNPMLLADAILGKPPQPAAAPAPVAVAAPVPAAGAPAPSAPATPAPPASAPVVAPVVVAQATPQELLTQQKIQKAHEELNAVPGWSDLVDRAKKDPLLDSALTAMMGEDDQSPEQTLKSITDFKDKLKANPQGLKDGVNLYDTAPESMRRSILEAMTDNPALGRDVLANKEGAKGELLLTTMAKTLGVGDPSDKNNPLSGIFGKLFGGGQGMSSMFAQLGPMIEKIFGSIIGSLSGMMKAPALMNMGSGALLAGALTALSPNDPQIANKPITDATTGITTTVAQIRRAEPVEPATPGPTLVAKNDLRDPKGPGGPGGGPPGPG